MVTHDTEGNAINLVGYRVYARANAPTFIPTPADRLTEQTGTTFLHPGGAADPTMVYTYIVTAVANNCSKKESAPSNPVTLNHAPIAAPQTVTTNQGSPTQITLSGADADGNALTYRIVSAPSHGTVSEVGSGSITATVAADTWVNRLSNLTNYGSNPTLSVSKAGAGMGNNEALIQFALPSLPDGAAINSATMFLNQIDGGDGVGSIAVQAREVTKAWEEGAVTFKTIPTYGTASMGKTTVFTNLLGEYAWDLTSQVQSWYAGTPNYGVLLGDTAGGTDTHYYATKESGSNAPRLVIQYAAATIPTLVYTPLASYSGPDKFTFVVNDGQTDSEPVSVDLNVVPVVLSDLIFKNGFEAGNLTEWSSYVANGDGLHASDVAAMAGNFGLEAAIANNNVMYVNDDSPQAEPRYRARFYFDPNSISMASGNNHAIFYGYSADSTVVLRIVFRFYLGSYQIRAALLNSAGTWKNSAWQTISDAPHSIEFDWRAATTATATNGYLMLWIDGVQVANVTGSANNSWRIDRVSLGTVTTVVNKTRGNYFFDEFESRKESYIGP
jgi:hypothetical protein